MVPRASSRRQRSHFHHSSRHSRRRLPYHRSEREYTAHRSNHVHADQRHIGHLQQHHRQSPAVRRHLQGHQALHHHQSEAAVHRRNPEHPCADPRTERRRIEPSWSRVHAWRRLRHVRQLLRRCRLCAVISRFCDRRHRQARLVDNRHHQGLSRFCEDIRPDHQLSAIARPGRCRQSRDLRDI